MEWKEGTREYALENYNEHEYLAKKTILLQSTNDF